MTAFSDFYRHVLPYAPGASGPSIDNALRNAAIEFCERTNVWQEFAGPISAMANVGTYDIDCPAGAAPVKVLSMSFDGRPLAPKTADELDAARPNWMSDIGLPACFTQLSPEQFMLVPIPAQDAALALKCRVAYKPSISAASLPNVLGAQYARDIARGALAQLLLEPNAPYSNAQMAAAYAAMFESRIIEVGLHVAKAFGRAPVRVRGSFF